MPLNASCAGKLFLQTGHDRSFSPVWMIMCFASDELTGNDLEHNGYFNVLVSK